LHLRTKQREEIHGEQVINALDRYIYRRISRDDGGIVYELTLAWKHRGDAISPGSLHRRKDAKFVVNQRVVLRRIWSSVLSGESPRLRCRWLSKRIFDSG